MRKIIAILILPLLLFSCENDFLEETPPTGLSADKLTDLASMQGLIYGAYGAIRPFVSQPALYAAGMMRDVLNRNRGEYDPFYDHEISTSMTSWMYTSGYTALASLNKVAVSDLVSMEGSQEQKNAILGDMHFLRALIYFELNNYWNLPLTGYTIPLVLAPVGTDDRLETATTLAVQDQIEFDIESARSYFLVNSGESNYMAATALSARIYFYHEKYDSSYARANEVIESGLFSLGSSVTDAFVPKGNSSENIFTIKFNTIDGSGLSPSARIWEVYQASLLEGNYSLNLDGSAASMIMDPYDDRFNSFYSANEDSTMIYVSGKYTTDQMDYRYIRLAEMYLTRAEANIMKSDAVVQQDVDDINLLRIRGGNPASNLAYIPTVNNALTELYDGRTKELAFELGDHFLNTKRLKREIIQTADEGGGTKSYMEYSELLVFPFPEIEVDIHGLTRIR